MARAPRASVSKTSGQGVSRLSYQKGYKLRGGAGSVPDAPKPKLSASRSSKIAQAGGLDMAAGDTIDPKGLINILDTSKPDRTGERFLRPGKTKKLKAGKSHSAYVKARK